MKKEFILKETEKAIMVKGVFSNTALDGERKRTFWVPKRCIDEKGQIAGWFIKNKIEELFDRMAGYITFEGLTAEA